jgi:septal ring factor EnvC (AmiA/AmiB activator)
LLAQLLCAILLGLPNPVSPQETAPPIDTVLDEQAASDQDAQVSQQEIDRLADDIAADIAENRQLTQQINRLRIYNSNLAELVADQTQQKESLIQQIAEFGSIEQGTVPLLTEMIATLRRFIELDMPFLQRERSERIARLAVTGLTILQNSFCGVVAGRTGHTAARMCAGPAQVQADHRRPVL